MVQDDIKRLLAYSSISQMGYILFGLASFTQLGVAGSMFQYVSHGTAKGILFIVAGSPTCDFSKIPIPVLDYKTGGYDGQYYFRLALDPLASQQTAFGITLDHPAYRQQRILYPALAHLFLLLRGLNSRPDLKIEEVIGGKDRHGCF